MVVLEAAIVTEALLLATPLAEVVAVFVVVVLARDKVYTHCTMMVQFKIFTSGNLPYVCIRYLIPRGMGK